MKITITHQFQEFLKSINVQLGDLLEKAEVPNLLWKEELTLDNSQYYRLLEEFDKVISDKEILSFSNVNNISTFVPAIYAALSANNGVNALIRFEKFKKIIGPMNVNVQSTDNLMSISFSFITDDPLPRFAILQEQLLLLSLFRVGTGQEIKPRSIDSPYNYGPEVVNFLGIQPNITQGSNSINFNVDDLKQKFLTQNNVMWEYLEPELQNQLINVTAEQSLSSAIESTLFKKIPSGKFSIDTIASSLGLSVRTLQRNLNKEGISFNQLVKKVQKTLSVSFLLDQSLSTDEIVFLVGYSDLSSFSRAFKNWTGITIREYKEQNLKVNKF